MSETINFIKSTVPSKDEVQRGIDAYNSELDNRFDDKPLMVLSDEEMQSELNNLKELGYSQDAIDFIIDRQKKENNVILPHKLRSYCEFNSLDDAVKHYGHRYSVELATDEYYDELKNGHVLVFDLPDETKEMIMKYIG